MKVKLVNPKTEKELYEYEPLSSIEIKSKIDLSQFAFNTWSKSTFEQRSELFQNVIKILDKDRQKFAEIISLEMGKNIEDALSEIDKCKTVCDYYSQNAKQILQDEFINTEAEKSYVRYEPLGIIFAIMPWNFPFWQVFRFCAPALMAGNTGLLKHASNVPRCAQAIENIFIEAGFPNGVFQNLLISSTDTEQVVGDLRVKAVTLTGSESAGSKVASLAGKYLKKVVLELGGSDPFIVLEDADVEKAAKSAVASRMIVSGQSCIAAKRFIVHEKIFDDFVKKMIDELKKINYAPLVSSSSIEEIDHQVSESIKMGAVINLGGKRDQKEGFYYQPTILTNITESMPVWNEETFGPVAPIVKFKSTKEALEIANKSKFGLGASVWTRDSTKIDLFVNNLEAGSVFVNSIVKSDARIPFGGTKASGFGRELSSFGIKEFVNVKTVWIS